MATIQDNNTTTGFAKKKAAAFINIHVVSSKDSEQKRSLGGVPLYSDNPLHAALLEHMAGGGDVTIEHSVHVVSDEVKFDF